MVPETIGRYRITDKIGEGAMGVVYRGFDPLLERTVAIKTIRLDFNPDERADFDQRFLQEAKSAGRLNHPNIVTVYDAGESGDIAYIAMEYLEGKDLRQLMVKDKPIPADLAVDIVGGIADGLGYAHRHGVVHRDVKPANIMVLQNGAVKLADFGIAHLQGGGKTQTSSPIGTPAYMAPEQFAGTPVDGRADIFSLGVILYQLLTGRVPFDADTVAGVIYRVVRKPARVPSTIVHLEHPGFDYILAKALAKAPEDRYQTANEFALDLRRVHKLDDTVAPVWPTGGLALRKSRRHAGGTRAVEPNDVQPAWRRWWPAAAGVALAGTLAAAYLLGGKEERHAPPPAPAVAAAPPAATGKETPNESVRVDTVATHQAAPPGLRQDQPERPTADAAPAKAAAVALAIAPWGEVLVDGERKGVSPPLTRLQLAPGAHRIEIRNAGAAPVVREVTLAAGETLRLKHKF